MEFAGIIGNNKIKDYLRKSVKNNSIVQSYLFIGTDGIGKKLLAKEFAKMVLCKNKIPNCDCKSCKCFLSDNHPDFFLINENGENIKIDQIREITNKVLERPIISTYKVYVINDCDKMTVEAQNCLLKTLEEPPEFVVIILISSNASSILNTIKSRCMKINFQNISNDEIKKYAIENLGYTNIDENMLELFNGSIGKAILQKENQDKYYGIEKIVDKLSKTDISDILANSKVIYDKENIYELLEYMTICIFKRAKEDKRYINCIDIVNVCKNRLRKNCNFDMCIDTMLIKMWEDVR